LRRPSRNSKDPEANDLTLAYVDVAKNRNGETGEVRMTFKREFTRFLDREPESAGVEEFQSSEIAPEEESYSQDEFV
jgi:hypothetical protein